MQSMKLYNKLLVKISWSGPARLIKSFDMQTRGWSVWRNGTGLTVNHVNIEQWRIYFFLNIKKWVLKDLFLENYLNVENDTKVSDFHQQINIRAHDIQTFVKKFKQNVLLNRDSYR